MHVIKNQYLKHYYKLKYNFIMHVPTITLRSDLANENSYRYRNKEQDPWSNYIDFVARNYSPSLGRWHQIDPLADQFANWSPYSYTLNNPLIITDPTGASPQWYIDDL